MSMIGIGSVIFICVMFIHLGMGDTFIKIIRFDFVLFRCVKCLTFWSVLSYSLFCIKLPILASLSVSFASAYVSLWIDLILSKIADKYDYWYNEKEEELLRSEKDIEDSGK